MIIYIAGKITGDDNYKAKFEEMAGFLRRMGYVVLNPATLPANMTRADYMRICFAMIDTADISLFLDDYQDSDGAMLEHAYCRYIKKPMLYEKAVKNEVSA